MALETPLTTEQVKEIDLKAQAGDSPPKIAADLGMTYSELRYEMQRVGKKIQAFWRVVDLAPVDAVPTTDEKTLTTVR